MKKYLSWRAANWWLVGYSNGKSGEELANPDQLEPEYQDAYERGYALGKERNVRDK